MDEKIKPNYILTYKRLFSFKDTYRLKKNLFQPDENQKNMGVPIILSDKIDFKKI